MGDHPLRDGVPYRTLGRTGERVSAIGIGGWHLGLKHVDEPLSIRIIRHAIDGGINFLDNSGTTTKVQASSAWGKRSATTIATASS